MKTRFSNLHIDTSSPESIRSLQMDNTSVEPVVEFMYPANYEKEMDLQTLRSTLQMDWLRLTGNRETIGFDEFKKVLRSPGDLA